MKPFGEELSELLDERDMSGRELGRQTEAKFGWGSPGTISLYETGAQRPTMTGIEAISKVLKVNPTRFSEYRMRVLRHNLDPKKVGWEKAAQTLRECES